MRTLYDRKVAEVGRDSEPRVAGEMVTQAGLNYLNKVFFLSLCEDRHLPGFYRIMREFLPRARAETGPEAAAVFLGLLRRRIKDSARTWDPEDEQAYRALRQELAPDIQSHVIEQNSWRELIQVAFDLASEHFPLVYREDAYDYFRPEKDALAELIYDLSTKSFDALTNRHVGDIYQSLLSSRRTQQAKLGAFYTPHGDVEYMVSKLELTPLAAIRMFLLSDPPQELRPRLYAHDMLLHSPERPAMFTDAEAVAADPELDQVQIRTSREEVRRFYRTVGLVETEEDQAATA